MNPFTKVAPPTFDVDPKAVAEMFKAEGNPKRGTKEFVMSRSSLRAFAACPHRWLEQPPEEPTKAMDFGSLVDCLITTPQHFTAAFAVAPEFYPCDPKRNDGLSQKPWTWQANHCKDWRASREAEGKICVTKDTYEDAQRAAERFFADERLNEFCAISRKQAYCTVSYKDRATGLEIPFRIVVDYVPDPKHPKFGTCLGDLKTTADANPFQWSRHVFNQGYHYQAAVYLDAFNAATGSDYRQWCHLIVENEAPFEPARRILSAEYLEIGRDAYRRDLARYAQCLSTGVWPGHDDEGDNVIDGWRITAPEPWMMMRA